MENLEFNQEELVLIKDILNAVSHIECPQSMSISDLWDKLDNNGVIDIDEDNFDEVLENYLTSENDDGVYTYDCQNMPDDVRQAFFDGHDMAGNDCHVTEYVEEGSIVGDFLISELDCSDGDEVIVKHWW